METENIKIDWIFGYGRGPVSYMNRDFARDSTRLENEIGIDKDASEIVYCSGKYVIIFNITRNAQRYFTAHNNCVLGHGIVPFDMTLKADNTRPTLHMKRMHSYDKKQLIIWDYLSLYVKKSISINHLLDVRSADESSHEIVTCTFSALIPQVSIHVQDSSNFCTDSQPSEGLSHHKDSVASVNTIGSSGSYIRGMMIVYDYVHDNITYRISLDTPHIMNIISLGASILVVDTKDIRRINMSEASSLSASESINLHLYTLAKEEYYTIIYPITDDKFICGTNFGQLLLFDSSSCLDVADGHNKEIVSFAANSKLFLVSYSADMVIRLWNISQWGLESTNLYISLAYLLSPTIQTGGRGNPQKKWLQQIESKNQSQVCSISLSDHNTIALGTSQGEIFELSSLDGVDLNEGRPIVHGHIDKISGIQIDEDRLLSVGFDGRLSVWDVKSRAHIHTYVLSSEITCVQSNPSAKTIAIGLGGTYAGMIVILRDTDFSLIHEMKDSNYDVTIVRYSHNYDATNDILIAGYANGMILFYSIHDNYSIISRFVHQQHQILEIDLSVNCEYFRSLSESNDLLVGFVETGFPVPSSSTIVNDIAWQSSKCLDRLSLMSDRERVQNDIISSRNFSSKYLSQLSTISSSMGGFVSTMTSKIQVNDEEHLIYGTKDGFVGIMAIQNINHTEDIQGRQILETHVHMASVSYLEPIDLESYSLASSGHDGNIILWSKGG